MIAIQQSSLSCHLSWRSFHYDYSAPLKGLTSILVNWRWFDSLFSGKTWGFGCHIDNLLGHGSGKQKHALKGRNNMSKKSWIIVALTLIIVMVITITAAFAYTKCPTCGSRIQTNIGSWEVVSGHDVKIENGKVYWRYHYTRQMHEYCIKNKSHYNVHNNQSKVGAWVYVFDA